MDCLPGSLLCLPQAAVDCGDNALKLIHFGVMGRPEPSFFGNGLRASPAW